MAGRASPSMHLRLLAGGSPGRLHRWRGEIIALKKIDPEIAEGHGIGLRFDELGHREHVELLRDRDDRAGQDLVVGILRDAADELAIDLENVELELLEVPQRRVTRTEIIKR